MNRVRLGVWCFSGEFSATSADLPASAGRAPKIVLDRLQACLRAILVRATSIHGHLDALAAKFGEKSGLAARVAVAVTLWSCAPVVSDPNPQWLTAARTIADSPQAAAGSTPRTNRFGDVREASPLDSPLAAETSGPITEDELRAAGLEVMIPWQNKAMLLKGKWPQPVSLDSLRALLFAHGPGVEAAVAKNRAARTRLSQIATLNAVSMGLNSLQMPSFQSGGHSGMGGVQGEPSAETAPGMENMENMGGGEASVPSIASQTGAMGGDQGGAMSDDGQMSMGSGWPPNSMETLAANVARADVALAHAQLASDLWEHVSALDSAAFVVWEERERVALYADQHKLAQIAAAVATRSYEQGLSSLSAVLVAKNRADALKVTLEGHQRAAIAASRALARYFAADEAILPSLSLALPTGVPPVVAPQALQEYAKSHAPMVRMANQMAARMEAMAAMVYRQQMPSEAPPLRQSAFADLPRQGIPWDYLYGSPYLTEIQLDVAGMQKSAQWVANQTQSDIAAMAAEWVSMVDMLRLSLSRHIPRADQAVAVAMREYEQGMVPYTMVDEALDMQRMAHLERIRQHRDVWTMYSKLCAMAGGTP